MATYVNNLRLKEIATGDESGTWGTSTNTNLELIGEALGIGTEAITTNADTHTTTVADGSSDAGRAFYLKYTGTLDSACTITIGPNTMKRVQIIENATSGSQNIIISQGSGANVTIAPGKVAVVQLDGAGSGAAVLDALTDLAVTDSLSINGTTLTIGDATAEDTKIVFDGNAQEGAIISIEVAQHASSGPYTLAWNAIFEFVGDVTPTQTATDAKTDIYAFRYNGSKWQNIGISQNLTQS
jgi:hypothetical protein